MVTREYKLNGGVNTIDITTIKEELGNLEGVTDISINETTGSIRVKMFNDNNHTPEFVTGFMQPFIK